MSNIRPRVPIGLPISAVVLAILGFVIGPIIQSSFSEETLARNVLLNAIPFILIFVAIILGYITVTWLVVTGLSNNIPRRIYRPIETALIAGIVLGVGGMFQPWWFVAYRVGFIVLLVSTLGYILWSHVTPKGMRRQEEVSGVSVGEFGKGGPGNV